MKSNSKEFKALQSKWYAKLRKKGFKDIEHPDGRLKSYSSLYKYDEITFENKQDYYRFAGQFLYSYEFADKRERLIWQMHSEAKSIRTTVRELKKMGYSAWRDLVMHTVRRLVKIMLDKKSNSELEVVTSDK